MRRAIVLCAAAVAISWAAGSGAGAAVCASTLGPGSSFGGGVYFVSGSGSGIRTEWAFSFTPSVDCVLGTIEVGFHLDSGPNAIRISVVEDSGGLPVGSLVEETAVIGEMTADPVGSIVKGVFTGANLLSGGSAYWIVVAAEPVTGSTTAVWHGNNITLGGARAVRNNGGAWQGSLGVLSAFRVTEAPEVSVPALSRWCQGVLGAALVLLAGLSHAALARQRSKATAPLAGRSSAAHR